MGCCGLMACHLVKAQDLHHSSAPVAGKWCLGHLCCKTLHVVLLCVEGVLSDEEGEVGILDTQVLDVAVKPALDELPHREGPGAQYVTAYRAASSRGCKVWA